MPILTPNLTQAVREALEETGHPELASPKDLITALHRRGINIETLAETFSEVLFNGKLNVRHKVALDLAALMGVEMRKVQEDSGPTGPPRISIFANNVQINNMLAPERKLLNE